MKRDMIKTAESINEKIDPNYDLTASEIIELVDLCSPYESQKDKLYEALTIAFKYGYVLGSRATAKALK